jgi:hypothetical protein
MYQNGPVFGPFLFFTWGKTNRSLTGGLKTDAVVWTDIDFGRGIVRVR